MGKFLIPYSHSLLSLFISMTIIQIYDEKGIFEGELFSILRIFYCYDPNVGRYFNSWSPCCFSWMSSGEILFRCVILPIKLHFIPSLILYILLAISIVFAMKLYLTGFLQHMKILVLLK